MRTIYKYPLVLGMNVFALPSGATVKAVGQQTGTVTLWAEVFTDNEPEKRAFFVYGTGHAIPPGFEYVGTALCDPFVWHVYEQAMKS